MFIENIVQYVLTIVPALTAVIGMIVTFVVGVNKIKKSTKDASIRIEKISDNDESIKKDVKEILKENAELKKQLNEVMARMKHLYFVEKSDDKEE